MTTKNLATVFSAELEGIDARLIEVEVDVNVGIHSFGLVGLADRALSEAKERVNSALKNSGVKPPNRENRKIIVNLAPADVKKTGSQYDFAIALGYLLATKQIAPLETHDKLFLGELALDGRLRPVNGALNVAQMAAERGFGYLFLPRENASEVAVIAATKKLRVVAIESLKEAIDIFEGRRAIDTKTNLAIETYAENNKNESKNLRMQTPDFSEIKGQAAAKRALTIAAAGGHNLIMIGPPGVGKSFLARALAGILPDPTLDESIEITKIWSAAGLRPETLIRERPFRAPHQTISAIALIGGSQDPRPGEISLAHRGVLFLDEIPEFQRAALEGLRQPMESGLIQIARAKSNFVFPAKFMLIAAMNPCPCGYYGDNERECKCAAYEVIKYQKKISGPLLDRIDLQIKLGRVKIGELREGINSGETQAIKNAVERARAIQYARTNKTNSELTARETKNSIALDREAEQFIATLEKSRISPRGYYRILKVSRTIADLEGADRVTAEYLAEAFSYRLREEI